MSGLRLWENSKLRHFGRSMPEISWSTFTQQVPKGHLIIGAVPLPDEELGEWPATKEHLTILARVARTLRTSGLYALVDLRSEATSRDSDRIYCAFERKDDADKLAAVVGAGARLGDLSVWASERVFRFDASLAASLEKKLTKRTIGSRSGKRRASALLS